jgi:hypothetical protein
MQADGNLVIYLPTGEPIWSTDTHGHPGSWLVVQGDGNVVIYDPSGAPLWATGTVQPPPPPSETTLAQGDRMGPGKILNSINSLNAPYTFTYQGDGNLVLYRNVNTPSGPGVAVLWASGTNGRGRGVCIMQADGNLVIYLPTGEPIWSTDTHGHPGSWLVVQGDGNVVIYDPSGAPLWATNTVQLGRVVDEGQSPMEPIPPSDPPKVPPWRPRFPGDEEGPI